MTEATPKPTRSVRMSRDAAWEFTAGSHTGVFTSLRRDGTPIAIPIWFAAIDERIYIRTPGRSKKAARVRHNPRCSFLVESGTRWAELSAVHFTGTARILPGDDPLALAADVAITTKYAPFRTARAEMPATTAQHYEGLGDRVVIQITPDDRILSWDNTALGTA
jgi:PPOX class probable F420-dependent enzyme